MIIKLGKFSGNLKAQESGRTKYSSVRRCVNKECQILFETFKQYPHMLCAICRIERGGDAYKSKMTREFQLDKYLKKAHDLEVEKDKKAMAYNCVIVNRVMPKRFNYNPNI